MKKKAIIYGTGSFGELAMFYLEHDSDYEVVAFCESHPVSDTVYDRPLISHSNLIGRYSPTTYEVFVAIGYRHMNAIREKICKEIKAAGFKLISYVSSKATCWYKENDIGENVFIFENNTIQPYSSIGDGTILWSGNHIGHHTSIGSYCFITSHVVVSGHCKVGDNCFIGVNSTINDSIKIGHKCVIGSGAVISKDVDDNLVMLGARAIVHRKKSEEIFL